MKPFERFIGKTVKKVMHVPNWFVFIFDDNDRIFYPDVRTMAIEPRNGKEMASTEFIPQDSSETSSDNRESLFFKWVEQRQPCDEILDIVKISESPQDFLDRIEKLDFLQYLGSAEGSNLYLDTVTVVYHWVIEKLLGDEVLSLKDSYYYINVYDRKRKMHFLRKWEKELVFERHPFEQEYIIVRKKPTILRKLFSFWTRL